MVYTQMTRVALVTGAARGIGRSIALRLAADGLDIALLDLPNSSDALKGVAEEVVKLGPRAAVLTADVSNEKEVQHAIKECVEKLGSLDVVRIQFNGREARGSEAVAASGSDCYYAH